jgi:hypothetical protein
MILSSSYDVQNLGKYFIILLILILVLWRFNHLFKPYLLRIWKWFNSGYSLSNLSSRRRAIALLEEETWHRKSIYNQFFIEVLFVTVFFIIGGYILGNIAYFFTVDSTLSYFEQVFRWVAFVGIFGFLAPIVFHLRFLWYYIKYDDLKFIVRAKRSMHFNKDWKKGVNEYEKAIAIFPSEFALAELASIFCIRNRNDHKACEEAYIKAEKEPYFELYEKRAELRRLHLFDFGGAIADAKEAIRLYNMQVPSKKRSKNYGYLLVDSYCSRSTAAYFDKTSDFNFDEKFSLFNDFTKSRLFESRGDLKYYFGGDLNEALDDYLKATIYGLSPGWLNDSREFIKKLLLKMKRIVIALGNPDLGIMAMDDLLQLKECPFPEEIKKVRLEFQDIKNKAPQHLHEIMELEKRLYHFEEKDVDKKAAHLVKIGLLKFQSWDLEGALEYFLQIESLKEGEAKDPNVSVDDWDNKTGFEDYYEAMELIAEIHFIRREFEVARSLLYELESPPFHHTNFNIRRMIAETNIATDNFEEALIYVSKVKDYFVSGEKEIIETAMKLRDMQL